MKTITTNGKLNQIINFENAIGTASLQSLSFNIENYNPNTNNKMDYHHNMNEFIHLNRLSKDIVHSSSDELHFILSQFDYKSLLKDTNEISPSILFLFGLEDDFYKGNPLSSNFLYKMYPPLFFENEEKENVFYNKENEEAFFALVKKTFSNWDLDTLIAFIHLIRTNCPKRLRKNECYLKALQQVPRIGLIPLLCGTNKKEELPTIAIEVDVIQHFSSFVKRDLTPTSLSGRSRFISFQHDIHAISPEVLRNKIEKYLSFLVSPSQFIEKKSKDNIQNVESPNHHVYLELVDFIFEKLEYLTR